MFGTRFGASPNGPSEHLWAAGRIYTLEGHEAELDKLAGERATVKDAESGEKSNSTSSLSDGT